MMLVALLGFTFVASHFLLGSTSLRTSMVDRLGPNGFLGFYSVVAAVLLGCFVYVYTEVDRTSYWWYPDPALNQVTAVVMWFAAVLAAGSFMAPNPSQTGMESKVTAGARGVLRITRHPLMWGIGLWALAHIVANGDVVSVVFFGWFAVLALVGAALLDSKKKTQLGADWEAFSSQTSLVPFVAVLTGRTRLAIRELFAPLLVGSGVYAVMLFGHRWLSGVELALF